MTFYREIQIPQPMARDITEPAPVIQWLSMDQLVIDERYQRPLQAANWTAIRKIAAEFMWSRFSAVLVAPIEGGRYAIIDGQHRVHAAAMIGIKQVPAMIVMIRAEEQAKAFVDVNTKTVRIHANTLFKAALAAGDDWAVRAQAAVQAAGCRMLTHPTPMQDRKPGDVQSIMLIKGLIEEGRDWAVTVSLKALMDFEPTNAVNFSDAVLKPLMSAVAGFGEVDADLLVRAFRVRRPLLVVDAALRLAGVEGTNRAVTVKNAFRALIKKTAESANAA